MFCKFGNAEINGLPKSLSWIAVKLVNTLQKFNTILKS